MVKYSLTSTTRLFNPNTKLIVKVRKTAKIKKRYNQVPHLTQDTTWENNKNTINITNKSREVSPFPACVHKAATNRRESMRNTRHNLNTNEPQKGIMEDECTPISEDPDEMSHGTVFQKSLHYLLRQIYLQRKIYNQIYNRF